MFENVESLGCIRIACTDPIMAVPTIIFYASNAFRMIDRIQNTSYKPSKSV